MIGKGFPKSSTLTMPEMFSGKDTQKGGDPKPKTTSPESPSPKGISPERAHLMTEGQNCAACKYFDADSNEGVGECTKPVQVDFSTTDPSQTVCQYFEAGDEESSETPEFEKKEESTGSHMKAMME